MFKIIIADDEIHIRELITKCINQSGLGMNVVGAAENGEDAFRLIEQHQPGLLITDVCMPGTGGLDLIEKIRKHTHYQELKIIIISGYDEFLYVQKALKLGVSDYLLKPFLPEELLSRLMDIRQELERKQLLVQNFSTLVHSFQNQLTIRQERFLKQIISCNSNLEYVKETSGQMGIELNFTHYGAALLKLSSEKTGSALDAKEQMALEEILLSVKERYFHSNLQSYGMRLENNIVFLLFGSHDKNMEVTIRHITEGIARLSESLKRYYHVILHCALGHLGQSLESIPSSYEEARYVMRTHCWENHSFAMYRSAGKELDETILYKKSEKLEEELLLHIKMANHTNALHVFQLMLNNYTGIDVCHMEDLDAFLLKLLFNLENLLREAEADKDFLLKIHLHEGLRSQLLYGDIWEVQRFMNTIITEACHYFHALRQNKGEKIVRQIKLLIDHNLSNEEMDLEQIANQLYFSSNYLRRIFKQVAGESFSDYLIRRRMEAARDKLKDKTKKINDVSQECGYSNQRYFASAFKKYYGYTPTEYRDNAKGDLQ